jgi:hypothetical protein
MDTMITRRRFAAQFAARAAGVASAAPLAALGLSACGGGDDAVGFFFAFFVLTALIGSTDSGISVRPTGTGFLSLEPGVALEIDSDVPVVFTISATNVTIATPVVTSRSWRTTGVTSSAAGQFVLTVSLFGDSSVYASFVVNVTPPR